MDQSSACFTKYSDAKPRRDVLSPMFSRSSILRMQGLLQDRVGSLSISPVSLVHVDLSGQRALRGPCGSICGGQIQQPLPWLPVLCDRCAHALLLQQVARGYQSSRFPRGCRRGVRGNASLFELVQIFELPRHACTPFPRLACQEVRITRFGRDFPPT